MSKDAVEELVENGYRFPKNCDTQFTDRLKLAVNVEKLIEIIRIQNEVLNYNHFAESYGERKQKALEEVDHIAREITG